MAHLNFRDQKYVSIHLCMYIYTTSIHLVYLVSDLEVCPRAHARNAVRAGRSHDQLQSAQWGANLFLALLHHAGSKTHFGGGHWQGVGSRGDPCRTSCTMLCLFVSTCLCVHTCMCVCVRLRLCVREGILFTTKEQKETEHWTLNRTLAWCLHSLKQSLTKYVDERSLTQ